MRIYVAGPMTGIANDNVPAFVQAQAQLRALGHDVVIPCDTDAGEQAGRTWAEWMHRDIALLLTCEAVALLPGWERSRGACREVTVALTVDMPLFSAADLEPVRLYSTCARMEVARQLLLGWSRETFPARRAEPTREHLVRELRELADSPSDRLEIADVLMLTFALADCEGVDPALAVLDKLEIVRSRQWSAPDGAGVVEHVREPVAV